VAQFVETQKRTACQPKTCWPIFCKVNPEKPPEVVIGSAVLFEALSKNAIKINGEFGGSEKSRNFRKPP